MTEEKQRIAIAEECGYVLKHCKYHKTTSWHTEGGFCMEEHSLPDYLNDLNGWQPIERNLSQNDREAYQVILIDLSSCPFEAIHATAAMRAEAFLKTIGKWEDSE
jgi:hypothetical protein